MTRELKLIETKLRRRAYVQVEPDPIKDAMIIGDKVKKSSCFGAAVSVLALVAFLAKVLS